MTKEQYINKFPIRFENVSCALGCDINDEKITIGRDRLHNLPGEYNVIKCQSCGLIRTNPRPTPDSIGFYYPDDYGPYLSTQIIPSKSEKRKGVKHFLRPFIRKIFDTKSNVLPVLPVGKLLEVGCASGSFLHKMADEGWQVEGIEFSEKAALQAKKLGHPIYIGSIDEAPIKKQYYDLIVGWMVLEHLYDPVESLKKIHKGAKPGGWLVLSIPDASALEFRAFKNKWYALQVPNHLYHFTPDTLAKVLKISGWSLIKVQHQRNMNSLLHSIAYTLEDKGQTKLSGLFKRMANSGGIWFYIKFPLAWLYGITKQSGRMTIWARKDKE